MELANLHTLPYPYPNVDRSQVNECTICNFKSPVKRNFQRHLMIAHGIKLKGLVQDTGGHYATLGRVLNDYGISQNYSKKAVPERKPFDFVCEICHKRFNTLQNLTFHKESHKAVKYNQPTHTCERCGTDFLKFKDLSKHRTKCERAKDIHCQLCPFKSATLSSIQRHFTDLHNLICKAVQEPDFDQALNQTPYTLERAVEVEKLPDTKEPDPSPEKEPIDQLTVVPPTKQDNKQNTMFPCAICGREFSKERRLNCHTKYDKCYMRLFKSGK